MVWALIIFVQHSLDVLPPCNLWLQVSPFLPPCCYWLFQLFALEKRSSLRSTDRLRYPFSQACFVLLGIVGGVPLLAQGTSVWFCLCSPSAHTFSALTKEFNPTARATSPYLAMTRHMSSSWWAIWLSIRWNENERRFHETLCGHEMTFRVSSNVVWSLVIWICGSPKCSTASLTVSSATSWAVPIEPVIWDRPNRSAASSLDVMWSPSTISSSIGSLSSTSLGGLGGTSRGCLVVGGLLGHPHCPSALQVV